MARQRPTRIPTPYIDRIVIREVQYQFEVNRCRNEEIIVKCNFGWAWLMWAGRPRIACIVIREVQYQFEVNRCRNEEIIVKGNILGGRGLCGRGAPGLVMGQYIVEINRIVIREVQYQFEVNRCRNGKNMVNSNFGWVWLMWAGRPRIDRIVIREVQYQFEVNRCRNEEITVKCNFWWAWPMRAGRPRINRFVIRKVQYQFEDNRCINEVIIEIVARTAGQTDERRS
ncbi:hypothetical protein DPMN_074137 [Dreissena polymorpha]|uniref:Uncharacterized protein n=1 Tax=Dreissena polymorpha TaxID=45954 RepID=A0A9D4BLA5_DREPO|nr:hypothetical protein DPMN_074137 [Dreissena polymorpha]